MALKSRLVEALKACLRARGLTYAALAAKLGVSEATVKRMFSRGSFTLKRIEQILEAIELDLQELARLARDGSPAPAELSHDQEQGLARDERLFSVFWLIQGIRNEPMTLPTNIKNSGCFSMLNILLGCSAAIPSSFRLIEL